MVNYRLYHTIALSKDTNRVKTVSIAHFAIIAKLFLAQYRDATTDLIVDQWPHAKVTRGIAAVLLYSSIVLALVNWYKVIFKVYDGSDVSVVSIYTVA